MEVRIDAPKPEVHTTDSPPIMEHIDICRCCQFLVRIASNQQYRTPHIDKHVLLAISRSNPEDETEGRDDDDASKC